ncbi:phage terminase small subunit [Novosphingobium humi]|uniref:phage terminase small subunit n=1 Tax=Novosphingobium humi TaxID=2282397 RepID=UPI0025B1B70C|nr:phage terminase small subunit [Novosphingobium humi]WJS98191.1 phage terminase small subunit [Novosphingobium humi]
MISPFRRHQMHVRALLSGAAQPEAAPTAPIRAMDTPMGQEYAALRVALHDNLRSLSDIASIEARNPVKIEMARTFAPWIEGVLQAGEEGQAAQDEILVWNLIWAIDYRDWDYALRLAAHAIRFNLASPERYNRTVACFVAEDIAKLSLDQQEAVPHEVLCRVLALIEGHDMPDPAKAKLHKALARSFTRRAEAFDPAADNAPAGGKAAYLAEALDHARRAHQLDSSIGVKSDIRSLEKALRKLGPDEAGGGAGAGEDEADTE